MVHACQHPPEKMGPATLKMNVRIKEEKVMGAVLVDTESAVSVRLFLIYVN